LTHLVESSGENALATIISGYLSAEHRDQIADGCIFPALGPDAARHSPALIRSFETGIRSYLKVIDLAMQASSAQEAERDPAVVLSTMVGALVLSRLAEDETLSNRILNSAISSLLHRNDGVEAETAE
jgi:TetR/AcrR family transcriptional regulator, transcriptional repressor for nem operon